MLKATDPGSEIRLATQIHRLINAIEAAGYAILPRTNLALLQSIIETAVRTFNIAAGGIALITPDGQELEFTVAYNVINQNIIGMKFPINKGIAGYVAMTGQSLAVSSVDEDTRFNRKFAEKTGYIPTSILAAPLLQGEEVLGVIEVLDKLNGQTFDMHDIELLTAFANQAALAVGQSQQLDRLQAALITGLKNLTAGEETADLHHILDNQPTTSSDLIQLVELIKDISDLGEAERHACWQILRVFQEYSQAKSPVRFGGGFGR